VELENGGFGWSTVLRHQIGMSVHGCIRNDQSCLPSSCQWLNRLRKHLL